MLLKVYGASVLMLLLLRSLRRYKHTIKAHGRMQCILYTYVIRFLDSLHKDFACIFCSRFPELYIHQGQLLQGCQFLGHRCQHITLQVTERKETKVMQWKEDTTITLHLYIYQKTGVSLTYLFFFLRSDVCNLNVISY